MQDDDVLIDAQGLGLRTYAGFAYHDVDLTLRKGEVLAVRGRHGSGKTALLLTLAGRMKPSQGSLSVCGFSLPRQRSKAMKKVSLALFDGLNDLPASLTVSAVIAAEFELYGRRPDRASVRQALERAQIAGIGSCAIKDLTKDQLIRLGIMLALVPEPSVVVVDDIESQLTLEQSKSIMELLLGVARTLQLGVAVSVVERDLAAMADTCLFMSKGGE